MDRSIIIKSSVTIQPEIVRFQMKPAQPLKHYELPRIHLLLRSEMEKMYSHGLHPHLQEDSAITGYEIMRSLTSGAETNYVAHRSCIHLYR